MKKAILASLILINLYIPVIADMREDFNSTDPWILKIENSEATGGAQIWTIDDDPFLAAEFYVPLPGHYNVNLYPTSAIDLGENPGTMSFSYSPYNTYNQGFLWIKVGIAGEEDLPLIPVFRDNSRAWHTRIVPLPQISTGKSLELRGFLLETNPLTLNPLGNRIWIDNIESQKESLIIKDLDLEYPSVYREEMEYLLEQRPSYQDLEENKDIYFKYRTNFDRAHRIVNDLKSKDSFTYILQNGEHGSKYLHWYEYPPQAPLDDFLKLHQELKTIDEYTGSLELYILARGKLIQPYLEDRTPTAEEKIIARWAVEQNIIEQYIEDPLLKQLTPFLHENIEAEKERSDDSYDLTEQDNWELMWLPSGKSEPWLGDIDFSRAPANSEYLCLQPKEAIRLNNHGPPSELWIDMESDQSFSGLRLAFSDPFGDLILYKPGWQIFHSDLPQNPDIDLVLGNDTLTIEDQYILAYSKPRIKKAIILNNLFNTPAFKLEGTFSAGKSLNYYHSEGDKRSWVYMNTYPRYDSIDTLEHKFLFQGIIIDVPETQDTLKLKINAIGID